MTAEFVYNGAIAAECKDGCPEGCGGGYQSGYGCGGCCDCLGGCRMAYYRQLEEHERTTPCEHP